MTKITINNVYCQIIDLNDHDVIKQVDECLSYFVLGHEFTKAYKSGWYDNKEGKWKKWDGKKHLLSSNLKFLSGLLWRVEAVLRNNGIKFEIEDNRKESPPGDPIEIKNIEYRDYQNSIVETALREKSGSIQSATGSGKSIIIARILAAMNVKTIVYVTGIDLLYQMQEMFEKILKTKIGIIGDGKAEIHRINICTIWTASMALGKKYIRENEEDYTRDEAFNEKNKVRITKAIKEAELVFFDEAHMMACGSIQTINNHSVSARYKFGLSGSMWRDDGADLLLEAVCGPLIITVTSTELIKQGFLVEPVIHFVSVPKKDNLSSDKYQTIYKEYIIENEIRNDLIVKAAIKLVKANRKVLILVKNIKHGKILLEQLGSQFNTYFIKGDIDSDERNFVRKSFIEGIISIMIATAVYDQGIDIPNLDALILAGSGKSSGRAIQRLGRVIRPFPGKSKAIVVDFIDQAPYLLGHTSERIKIYRTEAGFKIKLPDRPNDTGKKDLNGNNESEISKTKKKKSKHVLSNTSGDKVPW